jgi:small-conductance mechanosensitive channel
MKRSSALCLLAAALAVPVQALAYWQWRDANGHMVYSDVPPSAAAAKILRAPGRFAGEFQPVEAANAAAATPAAAPAAAKTSAKPAAAPTPTAEEAFQKRREASLKAATEDARKESEAAERQARCAQLRNYATGLQQGMRAAVAGPDGSLQHLNSDQRQAEMLKTNASLEKNCS